MSRSLKLFPLLVVTGCLAVVSTAHANHTTKPNIIFVLSDDVAQGDLGCYGQKIIQTPRLDRMAEEGTRYLQAYCGHRACVLRVGLP